MRRSKRYQRPETLCRREAHRKSDVQATRDLPGHVQREKDSKEFFLRVKPFRLARNLWHEHGRSLSIDPARLPDDPGDLKRADHATGRRVAQAATRDVADLEHRMDLLLRRLYGRTSEKLDPAQLALFDTTPEEPSRNCRPRPRVPPRRPTCARSRPGHGRRRLPDRLKRGGEGPRPDACRERTAGRRGEPGAASARK